MATFADDFNNTGLPSGTPLDGYNGWKCYEFTTDALVEQEQVPSPSWGAYLQNNRVEFYRASGGAAGIQALRQEEATDVDITLVGAYTAYNQILARFSPTTGRADCYYHYHKTYYNPYTLIGRIVGGVSATLGVQYHSGGATATSRFVAQGETLTAYTDGVQRVQVNDSAHVQGWFGFAPFTQGPLDIGWWDDFSATYTPVSGGGAAQSVFGPINSLGRRLIA